MDENNYFIYKDHSKYFLNHTNTDLKSAYSSKNIALNENSRSWIVSLANGKILQNPLWP